MELPLTIADWAATEARFRKHFREVPADEGTRTWCRSTSSWTCPPDEREGKTPFIHAVGEDRKRLRR
jgi:pyruvate-ferredoxin/flavodoxin oxidoreductase